MGTKLFVGGLPYSSTQQALKDAFSQAGGVVSAQIITDRMTGRSKGFGFVEMATEHDAQLAIEMWNGKPFEGRTLVVNEARPMEPRAPRPHHDFGGGGGNRGFGGGKGGFHGGHGGRPGGHGGGKFRHRDSDATRGDRDW